jgi:hypothetical protein
MWREGGVMPEFLGRPADTKYIERAHLTAAPPGRGVKFASECLQQAKRKFDLTNSSAREIGLNHPDGTHLALQASKKYHEVMESYRLALQRFCDLILRGEIPSEEEPPNGS